MEKLELKLANGKKIIAEIYPVDSDCKEISIYLADENGFIIQDLAVVREPYMITKDLRVLPVHDEYEVLVYADEYNEDYTHRIEIKEYKGE